MREEEGEERHSESEEKLVQTTHIPNTHMHKCVTVRRG